MWMKHRESSRCGLDNGSIKSTEITLNPDRDEQKTDAFSSCKTT